MPSRTTKPTAKSKNTKANRTRAVVKGGSNKTLFGLGGFQLKVIALVFVLAFGVIGAIKINGSDAATYKLSKTDCYLLGRVYRTDGLCKSACLTGAGTYTRNSKTAYDYCSLALSTSVSAQKCDTLYRRYVLNQGCARKWVRTVAVAPQCENPTDTYNPTGGYDYCTNATVSQTVNGWAWPVPGSKFVGSYYAELNPKGVHKGIDIGDYSGLTYQENIVAAHGGTVTKSWSDIYCGQMVVISASGTPYYQGYQHIIPSSLVVGVGTVVKAGQPLGKVGMYGATTCGGPDTFYHLHFSVEKGNWLSYYSSPLTNSIDPCSVLQCPPKP